MVCMNKNRKGFLLGLPNKKSIELNNGKRLMGEAVKLIKAVRECRLKMDVGLKYLLRIDEKGKKFDKYSRERKNAEESKKIPLGWIDLSFEIFLQLCQGEYKGKR